ncbi:MULTISPECIES: hypothetical protein [Streptomyces]|uniref:hypothetical protein n=1 Tax=Streptomyces TaxID=1883 RepID=UPI001D1428B6|nr:MULTISPECIES: hypothetical protein [Streptomyces]MCC3654654.1 hypothetical protein [Streptomyces sp. S07_1.15]WSQ70956.1 hypothetical protein OG463_05575 [Streptomyces xinghaiensis]
MTNENGGVGLGRKILIPLLAVGVLAVGAHLWLNTNLFGPEDVCGGLVSTDSAEAVFTRPGRISDRDGLDDRPRDRLHFRCIVESSSFLPGSDTERISLSGSRERGDFVFTEEGRWPSPATMSFFSGGATGAVGAHHGWVLLPGACTTADGPAAVEGYVPEGSDPVEVARLLTEVANHAAERADCAAERPLTAPDTLDAAPEPRRVRDGAVCGLPGLGFPGPDAPAEVMETVQDHRGRIWACEVAGYATYSVTREPRIVEGIRSSPRFKEQPRVAGMEVSGFDSLHLVADCAGTPTYFSLEFDLGYTSTIGDPRTPRVRALLDNFAEVVGKRFGCSTATS